MASIKDVAKLAGVSDKTVSRVVNKEPNVKAATVEKVEAAIRELGYVPNLAARLVRNKRSRIIGIMTDLVSVTPYSSDIVRGAQEWAHSHNYTVIVINTDGKPENETAAWRTFQEHRIEGVLYVTMYHREVALTSKNLPLPAVLVNCRSHIDDELMSVAPNDYSGSKHLTEHLLKMGHRHIGYIRLNPILLGAEQRYLAFLETVRAAGINEADLMVEVGMEGEVGQESNYCFEIAKQMLQDPNPPTAIMCGNDEIALQAYLAALSLGKAIPEDISIVGFDDFRTVSQALKPRLTTAALPYFDLGFQASELLMKEINQQSGPYYRRYRLECPLIARESVKNLT